MTEILDIYDDALNHLGTKPRPDVHRDGDWHRVFHCWVVYRDEAGQDWVIVQKRAANKRIFPDHLDVSAAGHYEAGETPRDGLRELEEELGLIADFEDLIPIGRRVTTAQYDGLIDREVADVFFYICDQPLREYRYQQSELAGLVAVNVTLGLAMFAGERDSVRCPAAGLGKPEVVITPEDFIPAVDHYPYKVLLLARRCLNGEQHLLV